MKDFQLLEEALGTISTNFVAVENRVVALLQDQAKLASDDADKIPLKETLDGFRATFDVFRDHLNRLDALTAVVRNGERLGR